MDRTTDFRRAESMSLRDAAAYYLSNGVNIVPLNVMSKGTHVEGWNSPGFEPSLKWWDETPNRNIGFLLGRNHLLSLDLDFTEGFKQAMEAIWPMLKEETGVEVPFWRSNTAGISSGRNGSAKLIFAEPEYCPQLTQRALSWVDNSKDTRSGRKCVFELRCGALQDVVPPSIHPETMKPYRWVVGSESEFAIRTAPVDLMYLWVCWDDFLDTMTRADPNYVEPPKVVRKKQHRKYTNEHSFMDIADAWSMRRNLVADLTSYDYSILKNDKRVLYDYSHTGTPGVVVYPGCPDKFISYHSGDFFFCQKNGGRKQIYSAFDLLCHYEYNDNKAEAIRKAKEDLGING